MWGGVGASGKLSTVLVGQIVITKERGPFHGESVFQQMIESAKQFKVVARPCDPITRFLVKQSRLENGGDPLDVTSEDCQEWLDDLDAQECFQKKPLKVSLTH